MRLQKTTQVEVQPSSSSQQPTKQKDDKQQPGHCSSNQQDQQSTAPEASSAVLRIKQLIHDACDLLSNIKNEPGHYNTYSVSISNTVKHAKYTEDIAMEITATPHTQESLRRRDLAVGRAQARTKTSSRESTTLTQPVKPTPFPLLYKCLWGLSDPDLRRDDSGIYPMMSTVHDCLIDGGGNLNVVLVDGTETHDELVQKVMATFPYCERYHKGKKDGVAVPTLEVERVAIVCKVPNWGDQEDVGDGVMGPKCNDVRLFLRGKTAEQRSLIWDVVRTRGAKDLVLIDFVVAEETDVDEEDFEVHFERIDEVVNSSS